jgi:hypothetical protein
MATKKKAAAAGAVVGMPYAMTAEEKKRQEDYQAEDDLRTLVRANEIRADPRRLARAKAKAKEQIAAAQGAAAAIS